MIQRLILLLLLFAGWSGPASAHEVRPALLEIERSAASLCTINWKKPEGGEVSVRLVPHLSAGWLDAAPKRDVLAPDRRLTQWVRPGCTTDQLEAQSVSVDGLDATITDVVVRVDYGDGGMVQHILRPGDPPLTLRRSASPAYAVNAYFKLGVEHILEGIDHLAFVLALILLVGFRARLLAAITGFTVAHSITLCVTALGLINPWPALIETLVALSIVFVAAEVVQARRGASTLTIRWPEIAALSFGLLHGFAFAGALAEIGLPKQEMLFALLLFNLGVEVGQLLFVGFVFLLVLAARAMKASWPRWSLQLPPYAIGSVAAFWFIDRLTALFA